MEKYLKSTMIQEKDNKYPRIRYNDSDGLSAIESKSFEQVLATIIWSVVVTQSQNINESQMQKWLNQRTVDL